MVLAFCAPTLRKMINWNKRVMILRNMADGFKVSDKFFYILFLAFYCPVFFSHICQYFCGIEEHMPAQKRFISLRFKTDGEYDVRVSRMLEYKLPERRYFPVDALVVIVPAIWSMHGEVEGAAGCHNHIRDGIGKSIGPPPVGQVFWFRKYFPHQSYRCVQGSCEQQLTVTCVTSVFHYVVFLIFPDRFQGHRACFPNAGDIDLPRRILHSAGLIWLRNTGPFLFVL